MTALARLRAHDPGLGAPRRAGRNAFRIPGRIEAQLALGVVGACGSSTSWVARGDRRPGPAARWAGHQPCRRGGAVGEGGPAADPGADARLVDAVRRDLFDIDGNGTATAGRILWTGDHIDAARRLEAALLEPARATATRSSRWSSRAGAHRGPRTPPRGPLRVAPAPADDV